MQHVQKRMIPLNKPFFTTDEYEAVMGVLASGMVSQGEKVEEFEDTVRKYVGAKYAVAFNSATTAIYTALRYIVDLWDCMVAIPAFTFPAAQKCVEHFGGEMSVWNVDVRKDTYNLDMCQFERQLERSGKNRVYPEVVIPIHQFGLPIKHREMKRLREKYEFKVIEDAACALGSKYECGQKIGNEGTAVFSFHGRKIITTGEGGMLVTDNEELYEAVKAMRQFGRDDNWHFKRTGLNFKMSDIAAAIGIEQMKKLDRILANRSDIAKRYNWRFKQSNILGDIRYVTDIPAINNTSNYQSCVITLSYRVQRNKVIQEMKQRGIETQIGSYDYSNGTCRNSAFLAGHTLALPIWPEMTTRQHETIVTALEDSICHCV